MIRAIVNGVVLTEQQVAEAQRQIDDAKNLKPPEPDEACCVCLSCKNEEGYGTMMEIGRFVFDRKGRKKIAEYIRKCDAFEDALNGGPKKPDALFIGGKLLAKIAGQVVFEKGHVFEPEQCERISDWALATAAWVRSREMRKDR